MIKLSQYQQNYIIKIIKMSIFLIKHIQYSIIIRINTNLIYYILYNFMETPYQAYICPICIQYCVAPIETECCHHLFCKQCYTKTTSRQQRCAYCRSNSFKTIPRKDVQQILNEIILPCENEGCKQEIKKGKFNQHVKLDCDFLIITCSFCEEKGIYKYNYLEHMGEKHKDELETFLAISLRQIKQKQSKLKVKLNSNINLNFDPLIQIQNKRGILAKRGTLNRYYCGGQLDMTNCFCDGYCGPNNGCCCCACMQLTLEMNGVLSKNCLINYQGSICKVQNGIPYCGVRLIRNTDSYCGLQQRCQDCRQLQSHRIQKYKMLYK